MRIRDGPFFSKFFDFEKKGPSLILISLCPITFPILS